MANAQVKTQQNIAPPDKSTQKIKVLNVLASPGFGGIETLALATIQHQKNESNISPAIYYIFDSAGGLANALQKTGVPVACGNFSSGLDCSPSKIWKAAKTFAQFDIVHMHSFNPAIALAAIISKVAVVYTEHGALCVGRTPKLSDYIKLTLHRFYLNHFVDFVSFNSQWTKHSSYKLYGLKKTPNETIYNGITLDTNEDTIQEPQDIIPQKFKKSFTIGCFCRLVEMKRVDRILNAFALFKEHKDSLLIIAGDGPKRSTLEKQCRDLGIQNNVLFCGNLPHARQYQAQCDIGVLGSSVEPFGLVAVEFYSLGKPFLIFEDAGGVEEIVGPCEPRDIAQNEKAFARRLSELFNQGEISKTEQDRYKTRARQFDVKDMSLRFAEVYEKLYVRNRRNI